MEGEFERNRAVWILLALLVAVAAYVVLTEGLESDESTAIAVGIIAFVLVLIVGFSDLIRHGAGRRERKAEERVKKEVCCRTAEKKDWGKKIYEVKYSMLTANRDVAVVVIGLGLVIVCAIAVLLLLSEKRSDTGGVVSSLVMILFSLFATVLNTTKCEVYEKGIKVGHNFIKWGDIMEVRRGRDYTVLLLNKYPKKVKIFDRDGVIEEMVKEKIRGSLLSANP